MSLKILKDAKKMYISVTDPSTNVSKVMDIFLKQAQQVLMHCDNDFRRFVAELLCINNGDVSLRDVGKVLLKFMPTRDPTILANLRRKMKKPRGAKEERADGGEEEGERDGGQGY